MEGLVMGMQCSGHGTCKPWDGSDQNSPVFCHCDKDWADPECRTKRKSQTTAFLLSLVGGFFGLDQFYLGNTGGGVVKLLSLGGLGILYLHDVVDIGTGAPYATVTRHSQYKGAVSTTTYRVSQDLPKWFFVVTSMVAFYALGFTLAGISAMRYVRLKRAEFMLLKSIESRTPGLTAMSQDFWLSTNFPEMVRLKAQFAKGKGKGKGNDPAMSTNEPPFYGATESMPSYMPAGYMMSGTLQAQ